MGGLGALATTAKTGLTWSRWVWPGWWPRRSDDRDMLDMLQEGMAFTPCWPRTLDNDLLRLVSD